MQNFEIKIKKIRGLTPEVEQFHPLLKDLLPKLNNVTRVEYIHGSGEMGADFIVTVRDATLGMDEYIGVIVKCGDIRQDHESLERQIKECAVPRKVDGGRKQIHLNQIWVIVVNGDQKPRKYGAAFFSGIENASSGCWKTAPKPGQGQAAALCSLAKRTLDAA